LKENRSILVAADSETRARRATRFIADAGSIRISVEPMQTVSDFEASRPAVLVLAFDTLAAAQDYRNRLFRSSRLAHVTPHQTIVLCSVGELQRAYEACEAGVFDDYVLFWPQPFDVRRLDIAIHHALSLLSKASCDAIGVDQLAAHARHIARLTPNLADHAHRFAHEVGRTHAAADAAARSAGPAFQRCFRQVGESVDALCTAAQALAGALGPQLQAARVMGALADRVRPTVLAVEDDAFERTLLSHLLENTKVELIHASTGAQAFNSIWTRRPDLVLMDIDLPDLNGMEITRRLKSVEPLASIPVVLMAAYGRRTVVMESLKAGAAGFMIKPLHRATLLDKIEAFLPGSMA
jgi:CheY-like chemotaxis protein